MDTTRTGIQKIDPEFKAKWVAALRSGKYEQAQRILRGGEKQFCCIGVACDILDPTLWQRPADELNVWSFGKPILGSYSRGYYGVDGPSDSVLNAMGGLTRETMYYLTARNDGTSVGSCYNPDGEQLTLPQIADFIEENL